MTRALPYVFLLALLSATSFGGQSPTTPAQQNPAVKAPPAQQPPEEANPPEEDESVAPRKYVLNPLESDRNLQVGNFYWRKKDYRGALSRYEDATRYNPSSAQAFFKVGEAEEKLNNRDAAKAAFKKVLVLAPDSKLAQEAKKKLGSKS